MDLRDVRNLLEDLNLPALWEEHRAKITIAASTVVVACFALVLLRCDGGETAITTNQKYFFDLNTGQIVVGSADLYGPVDLGGGGFAYPEGRFGSAVEAAVVSCNDCVGIEPGMTPADLRVVDAKLAYLTRYPAQVRELLVKMQAGDPVSAEEHNLLGSADLLYSTAEGKTWLPELSGPATQLVTKGFEGCGARQARTCTP